jgi:hypothetical protein
MDDEKPFRVNSWCSPDTGTTGEVWWDGVDRYVVYVGGIRRASYPYYEVFGKVKGHLLAVGEACKLGYRLTMGKDWEG